MMPPYAWRCWTVPARVVRAAPRYAHRHVWRPVRHFAAHHAVAVAVVSIPATVVCVAVPGWYALSAPPAAVEGGGAPLVWYGGGGGFGVVQGVPEGGAATLAQGGSGWGVPGDLLCPDCGRDRRRENECERHPLIKCEVKKPVRIPEPSSLALFGFGAATLMWLRRTRRNV
jgi:hypothetical protein